MGIDRYRELGIIARQKVQEDMRSPGAPLEGIPFRLTEIDASSLAAWRKWRDRRVDWDWSDAHGHFRSHQKRMDMAAWVGEDLAGLALAIASNGEGDASNVTLHLIERDPSDGNPLKGIFTDIIVDAMDAYAILLPRQNLKLKNPARAMVRTYIGLGFQDAPSISGQAYMQRRVAAC